MWVFIIKNPVLPNHQNYKHKESTNTQSPSARYCRSSVVVWSDQRIIETAGDGVAVEEGGQPIPFSVIILLLLSNRLSYRPFSHQNRVRGTRTYI